MSIFVPVLLAGALASAAWVSDVPVANSSDTAAPPRGDINYVSGVSSTVPGLGSYLIGAVADLGGMPDVALKGYMGALADDPDSLELRQRTFELSLMSGDMGNAVRLARTLPEVNQTTMSNLVRMADDAHSGKIDKARKVAREITKTSPDLLQFRLMQAYLDYAHGSRVPQLVAWIDSLDLPSSMAGRKYYHEARLWLKAGEPEKALVALKKAHAAEPGAVGSTILLGQTLARQGQPDAAAAVYDTFRAENPAIALLVPEGKDILANQPPAFASTVDEDLSATLADFGLLVWAQGAIAPARQVLNLTLWLNPDDIYTRYYLGLLLEMGGDLPAAAANYDVLAHGNVPEGVRIAAEIRLAEVAYRGGDKETPWQTLSKLAEEHPDVIGLQRSVAQMAFNRGEFDKAASSYSNMIDHLPAQTPAEAKAELLFARGAAYERGGNPKAATTDLQAALALMPAEPQVLNYLGYMWIEQGTHIQEAFEMLQKAHLLAPQDGAVTDSLGWAYYKQGDYATAMTYLEHAVEQEPESAEIFDHLGDAYAKLGRKDDARLAWQRALDLVAAGKDAPDAGFAKAVKKKLR